MKGKGFDEGYQSVPVNWKASSARKGGFFKLLSEITGEKSWTPQMKGAKLRRLPPFTATR
jgi:hypothetical protein